MSANIKASTDGTQAIIGVGGVDQMTVSNAGVVTANSFVGAISGNASSATVLATGSTTARTLANRFADVVNVRDFGAVGDNVADDTAAINAAINFAYLQNFPIAILFPNGIYKITGPISILSKSITITGMGPRNSVISLNSPTAQIIIQGGLQRAADVTLRDIGINATNMSSGYAVVVDFAQAVLFDNVLIAGAYNAVSIRQTGDIAFNNCLIDRVRGLIGVYAYGSNVARNGENDQIDVLVFNNTIIQGTYIPGGSIPTAELLVLDGRVHTVNICGLRLLSALRGIVTKNTPSLPSNFVPRFITGSALEMESHYAECGKFDFCLDFWIDNIFAAGSVSSDGIVLGSGVGNWVVDKGSINSNWLTGLNINGASDVTVAEVVVYNNSLAGANVRSAIYINGTGTIDIRGGLSGKATWIPTYTEFQKYGIDIAGAFSGNITLDGVDLRGNSTGTLYDNGTTNIYSAVKSCAGYNPRGAILQSVGASPYSYTAGLTIESVNLYGGSGVVSSVGGVALANVSPCSFTLAPRQTVTISYVTVPTMAINKH